MPKTQRGPAHAKPGPLDVRTSWRPSSGGLASFRFTRVLVQISPTDTRCALTI